MSVEKFIVLYFPFEDNKYCTVKTAKWVSLTVFLILGAYTLPTLFELKMVSDETFKIKYCYWPKSSYRKIFSDIEPFLYTIIFFILMVIINCTII